MRKIVHITDLHIGTQDCRANIVNVVGRIIAQLAPDDHVVVVTGDIVDDETKGTLPDAWNTVLKPLPDAGFPLLNVPGNHDFGGGAAVYPKAVTAFYNTVGPSDIPVIKVTALDGLTFIGMDSQIERLHWIGQPEQETSVYTEKMVKADGLQGWIGPKQRAAIADAVAAAQARSDKIVVYLHHDPLCQRVSMGLGNYHQLRPLIMDKTTMLLCGHSHEFMDRCGEWGIPHFYNGGSSGGKGVHGPTLPDPVRIIDPLAPAGQFDTLK